MKKGKIISLAAIGVLSAVMLAANFTAYSFRDTLNSLFVSVKADPEQLASARKESKALAEQIEGEGKHGLTHDAEESSYAIMSIGDVLQNSIAINELNARDGTDMSYVMIGYGQNERGVYVIRSIINKYTNSVTDMQVFNLYAVKAKKDRKRSVDSSGKSQSIHMRHPVSTISIRDFLENVKNIPLINEVFSKDVAEKLGVERSKGSLTDGIRFALSDEKKAYTKEDARKIIGSIVAERLQINDAEGKLTRGTTKEAVEMLYDSMNTAKVGERYKQAYKIADFILDNTLMEEAYENDALYDDAIYTLGVLREYRNSFDLSGMKDEIKSRDRKELNLLWGSKNGKSPDKITMELRERGIQIAETNAIDEFFEIVDRYDEAKRVVEEATAKRALTDAERQTIRKQITRQILQSYNEYGRSDEMSILLETVRRQLRDIRSENIELRKQNEKIEKELEETTNLKDAYRRGTGRLYSLVSILELFVSTEQLVLKNLYYDVIPFAIGFVAFYFIYVKNVLKNCEIEKRSSRFLILIFFVILSGAVSNVISQFMDEIRQSMTATICFRTYSFSVSFLCILLLYAYTRINRLEDEAIIAHAVYASQVKRDSKEAENNAVIQRKVHDLTRQLFILQSCTDNESIKEEIKEIRKNLTTFDQIITTGNGAMNTVLSAKKVLCDAKDINLSLMVDGRCLDFMEFRDIVFLFGNLLDNAIEGVETVGDKERNNISLIVQRKINMPFIHIENDCVSDVVFVNDLPQTTHAEKNDHGFGC